jgi:transcription initiation factor TFIIIB Brf1 subunit/transcription initiation factor TFIIB
MNDEKLYPKKCEDCGHNRWRTIEKRHRYVCRNCGNVRDNRGIKEGMPTKEKKGLLQRLGLRK